MVLQEQKEGAWNGQFNANQVLHVCSTHQEKQAEPQEKQHAPQDSWPVRFLHWFWDLGNASLDKIPGRCRDEGSMGKAPAPRWESTEVLGGEKSTQFLCHRLPESGRGQSGYLGMSTLTNWSRYKALGAVDRGGVFLGTSFVSDDSPYRQELGLGLTGGDTKSLV